MILRREDSDGVGMDTKEAERCSFAGSRMCGGDICSSVWVASWRDSVSSFARGFDGWVDVCSVVGTNGVVNARSSGCLPTSTGPTASLIGERDVFGGCALAAVDAIRRFEGGLRHSMVNPRAITFTAFGQPARVLSVKTLPPLPTAAALGPTQAVVKFIQSPINPSDINVVQGVYPSKPVQRPEGYYIPGNEGLAEIHELSTNSNPGLKVGDWVVMRKPQLGTWASHAMVEFGDILPLPSGAKSALSTVHAATLAVNPPTALRMLSDFVKLKSGDYFIQNAANSAVGRAAIQIAHASGIQSINLVRNRSDKICWSHASP